MQLITTNWNDYELLDCGTEEKLERFGKYIIRRPEPKALWNKTLSLEVWNNADATYTKTSPGTGAWKYRSQMPKEWDIRWNDLSFILKPTGFKHLGLFPEQAILWQWSIDKIKQAQRPIKVLNLFAYTGGATLAASSAGAEVTHVDAEKDIVRWASDNYRFSHLKTPVRWIVDDVMKFVQREVKRGNRYDAIIMDPPKFGRGSSNQVWKLEDDLPKLMNLCSQILTEKPTFVLINAYSISLSSMTLRNMLEDTMKKYPGTIEHGELVLEPTRSTKPLSTNIFAKWYNR